MSGASASLSRPEGSYRWWLLGLTWLVGINLRTSLIGLAPVLSLLQRDWGLSFAGAGLLFSLPLGVMGAVSLLGGSLADRWGPKWAMALSLALVALGTALRATAASYAALLAWTALLGLGIGMAQPCLTKVVKVWFLDRPGLATGIAASGLMSGAVLGVGLTPGLARAFGWRGAFWIWGGIAALTWVLWAIYAGDRRGGAEAGLARAGVRFRVTRPIALAALLFFFQSVAFYVVDVWLPLLYQSRGWSLAASARPLTAFELAMLVCGLTAPGLSDRVGRRRPFLLLSSAVFALGCVACLRSPLSLPLALGALLGGSYGTFFGLAMVLPVDLARREDVGMATGFIFTLGYAGSLFGPILSGALRDWTGSVLAGGWPALAAGAAFFAFTWVLPETAPRYYGSHPRP